MTKTHISYEVAKRLKEFLGKSAPEPLGNGAYFYDNNGNKASKINIMDGPRYGIIYNNPFPAYMLHDLLSKEFCEAMSIRKFGDIGWANMCGGTLWSLYFCGGMPAVEKALLEMMEA